MVGAPLDTVGGSRNQGSVYFFTRSGTVWTQRRRIVADGGAADDRFGTAVALSGDTLVVGADYDTVGTNTRQGSAYVFTPSGAGWAQRQQLTASDGAAGDRFGYSVALSADTLVVSAHDDKIGNNEEQGSAYVFTRFGNNCNTCWVPQQKLTASDGAANDSFGLPVAISGDTVVVGAIGDKIGNNENQGSAYVFVSPACPAITLDQASLPNGQLSAAYNQQLTASGSGVGITNSQSPAARCRPA